MSFRGKRVLITGGGGCLGLETAIRFDKEGASVVILDKSRTQLEAAKEIIPNVLTVEADLLNWDETRESLKGIGPFDHLVNNAGVTSRQKFMEVTPEIIDCVFGVNFKALVNVTQVVAGEMIQNGIAGTIVNISSVAGSAVLPNISIYSASKAAQNMLTRSMASELGPSNIRVNSVCPTYMETPLTADYIKRTPEVFKEIFNRATIKRFLKPTEVVDSILFLSSPAASMINGTALNVDGGYVAAS